MFRYKYSVMALLKAPSPSIYIDIRDFKIICRICLEKGKKMHPIFLYHDKFNENCEVDLSVKINSVSNITINPNDNLPENICTRCINLLLITHYFKMLSENSEAKLRSVLNKNIENVKVEQTGDFNYELKLEDDTIASGCDGDNAYVDKIMKTSNKLVNEENRHVMKIGECDVDVVMQEAKIEIKSEVLTDSESIQDSVYCERDTENHKQIQESQDFDEVYEPPASELSSGISDTDDSDRFPVHGIKILPLNSNTIANKKTHETKNNRSRIKITNQKILPLSEGGKMVECERKYEASNNILDERVVTNKKILPLQKRDQEKLVRLKYAGIKKRVNQKVLPIEKLHLKNESSECYECLICGTKYQHKFLLQKHMMLQHKDKKEYKCYACDLSFKTSSERFLHEMKPCPKMPLGSKYHCRECKLSFSKRSEYDVHMMKHSAGPAWDTLELEHLHKCPQCTYTTTKKYLLRNHIKYKHLDNTVYICETCGKHYTNFNTFVSHKSTHRTIVKMYKCAFCDYTTKYSTGLTCHQRTHTRDYRFTCEQCGKCFITNSALHAHHKRHLGVRDYQCTQCDKNYMRKNELVCHIESVHDKIRPYKCTLCDSAFYQKSKCHKHMRNVHKVTTAPEIPSVKKKDRVQATSQSPTR